MRMKTIFTLVCSLLMLSNVMAQSRIDYDSDSRWFWGLNMGGTWQTTDVKNKTDIGYGLTIGKSFNYNYGKVISFDIRARYLRGKWYGQDFSISPLDSTYSGPLDLYKDTFGYAVHNFQADVHRLGLELVLHANRIHERTGWDPYIFGGVGFTWYQTYGNLKDNMSLDGSFYDYDQLSEVNANSLALTLDQTYDTPLTGSNANQFQVGFMPSLGFGLGYQIGKRVSIGVEHKTTFTRMDLFDGLASDASKYKQDLYHYTSGYLRFHIKSASAKTKPVDPVRPTDPISNNQINPTPQPPIVRFINPANDITVNNASYNLVAEVLHVNGRDNIIFKQDSLSNLNFVYNTTSKRLESNVVLHYGINTFEVIGSNQYGTDAKTIQINYERLAGNPPVVSISKPNTDVETVSVPTYTFEGMVLHVDNKPQTSLTLNGQVVTNYTFSSTTHGVQANFNLVEGTNVVTLSGTNEYGADSKTIRLIYAKPEPPKPPVVTYVTPATTPTTSNNQAYALQAKVIHVENASQITVKFNGVNTSAFTYNANSDVLNMSLNLIEGANVISITGTNTVGSDTETTTIIYKPVIMVQPPVVTYLDPASSPLNVLTSNYSVSASVINVTTKNQIVVKLNGNNITNFTFNPSTHLVDFPVNLIQGSNVIAITGTNTAGSDTENTTIVYRKVDPPVVNFTTPATNPFNTNVTTSPIVATVMNVELSSQVQVIVNGVATTNFSWNAAFHTVSFTASLIEGVNSILITGTNEAGSDSKTQTIVYTKPVVMDPPVVSYVYPNSNPYTATTSAYTVNAKVLNVPTSQGIEVKVNGQVLSSFNFVGFTHSVTFSANLIEGANVIEVKGTNAAGSDSKSTTIIYKPVVVTPPPVVTITNPSNSPHQVEVPTIPVTASVLNVAGASNIQVLVNGATMNNFAYNAVSKIVNFNLNLLEGSNTIKIIGTNAVGQASDEGVVIYRKVEVVPPPIVKIINPAPNTVVHSAAYAMKASLLNINDVSQIQLIFNGQTIPSNAYTFNVNTHILDYNSMLTLGNNIFKVIGTNSAGTDAANSNVVWKAVTPPCLKPEIGLTSPLASANNVSVQTLLVSATILNISSASEVKLSVNGQVQTGASFNPTTKVYSKSITLVEGSNQIELSAQNACGDVSETRVVNFNSCIEPKLTVISASADENATVTVSKFVFAGSMVNLTETSQLSVTNNGQAVTHQFDLVSKQIKFQTNLAVGMNSIVIKGVNACGRDSKTYKINRKEDTPPCISPVIQKINPSSSNYETNNGTLILKGTVLNMGTSTNVSLAVNGATHNVNFDASKMVASTTIKLKDGINTIVLTAKNACGDVSETWTVNFNSCTAPKLVVASASTAEVAQVTDPKFMFSGSISGLTATSQLTVTNNGVAIPHQFNVSTMQIKIQANLAFGMNMIVIKGLNACGSDSKTYKIQRQEVITNELKPSVTLTSPVRCPMTVAVGTTQVKAKVMNVTNKNQITVTVNGQAVTNFVTKNITNGMTVQFPVNVHTEVLKYTIVITATNSGGSDSKSCDLVLPPPVTPPSTGKPVINTGTPPAEEGGKPTIKIEGEQIEEIIPPANGGGRIPPSSRGGGK
jgi:large repetitive protein